MFQVEVLWVVMPCSVMIGYQRFKSLWRWRQAAWYPTTTLHGKGWGEGKAGRWLIRNLYHRVTFAHTRVVFALIILHIYPCNNAKNVNENGRWYQTHWKIPVGSRIHCTIFIATEWVTIWVGEYNFHTLNLYSCVMHLLVGSVGCTELLKGL